MKVYLSNSYFTRPGLEAPWAQPWSIASAGAAVLAVMTSFQYEDSCHMEPLSVPLGDPLEIPAAELLAVAAKEPLGPLWLPAVQSWRDFSVKRCEGAWDGG